MGKCLVLYQVQSKSVLVNNGVDIQLLVTKLLFDAWH